MGFLSGIGDILDPTSLLDPLGISGQGAAEATIQTAQENADLLRRFSEQSQENLQPFLDLSNAQLPGLEAGASVGGFFDTAEALRPLVSQINQPIIEDRLRDLSSTLGAGGQTRSGFAATSAANVQEDADLSLLLQLQSMLTGRQQQVAGLGQGAGQNLAQLGQQSAEQLGSIQSQGILGGAQATAAGQQNLFNLAGLGIDFINQPSTNTGTNPGSFTVGGNPGEIGPQQITFPG